MDAPGRPDDEIDLSAYLRVLIRRRWIVLCAFLACLIGAALYAFTARPVYSAAALLLIEKERRSSAYGESGMVESTDADYYQTQYRLLKSRSLLRKVHGSLDLSKTEDFGSGLEALEGAVSVTPVRQSRLVHVSVDSHSPKLAARAANAVAEAYVAENLENKLFISKEILQALYPKGGKPPRAGMELEFEALPPVVNSALIQKLKGSYADMEARWGELSRRYTPEHPEIIRLKSQMATLQARIHEETSKIVRSMRAELSGRLLGNNVRIVDPAEEPASPSKPRKGRILALAALLGLLGGSLLALLVEALDQTIHSQEDVERKLGLTFLGAVPKAVLADQTLGAHRELLSGPESVTGEALKNVRTMIGFATASGASKTLLITSTNQAEGKTFLATSLAVVFAQLGERVLLIEGDLRRPTLHKRFGIAGKDGVSRFLAHGTDAESLADLVRRADVPGLDVLPCGAIPPNPSELLSTPRLTGLLAWAKSRYDRVIIDGTPVFPITDALLWGRHVDASVFVVKYGGVHAGLAAKALQKLQEGGLKPTGAVVNQVTRNDGRYGGYYHYYDYSEEKKP